MEDAGLVDMGGCMGRFLLRRGYAVVRADMRGTRNSDGCFDHGGKGDQADGYAVVQWIASQRWSNRRVGMYGVSHDALSQYAAAIAAPPALKAIIPIETTTSYYRYLYNNGVHYEVNMGTPLAYESAVAGPPPTNAQDENYIGNLSATTCNGPSMLRGMSLDGDFTNFFRERDLSLVAHRIKAAVFHVAGTRDQNVKMDHFAPMWRALERARVPRKAFIGPWGHSEPFVEGNALLEYWRLVVLRWFEHWLHGNNTGMMREPTVMSIDQTRRVHHSATFPPRGTRRTTLFASSGDLTTRPRRGTAEYQDVPGLPRQLLMDADGARLRYDSAPMKARTRIVGEPIVDIVAKINTTDTNFVAFLYDVAPDGTPTYLTRGYLDARHRTSLVRGRDVTPGAVLRYRVPLIAHYYVLAKGHRLRLLIASSDSCHPTIFVADTPTCDSTGVVSDTTAAHVTVLEGPGRTSVTIPVS
jgi:X-Pro dipeptidyl-peptidase